MRRCPCSCRNAHSSRGGCVHARITDASRPIFEHYTPVFTSFGFGRTRGQSSNRMSPTSRASTVAPFLAAGWMTFAALSTVPHMVTGTIWTNVPVAVALAFAYSIAPATLGLRLSVLGRALWWSEPTLRDALLRGRATNQRPSHTSLGVAAAALPRAG